MRYFTCTEDWYPLRAITNIQHVKEIKRAQEIWPTDYYRYVGSYDILSDELEPLESGSLNYAKKVIDLYITQQHGNWKRQVGTTEYIKYP